MQSLSFLCKFVDEFSLLSVRFRNSFVKVVYFYTALLSGYYVTSIIFNCAHVLHHLNR